VLNVGAGAGSYEPSDRQVTPVEPSESMRAQRPAGLAAAVDAAAEDLPFPDGAFDAAMTTFSVRQWSDLQAGLREVRRVTLGPVVILVPVPLDCTDWFNEAYYGRPEALLDPAARLSCSAWSFVGAAVQERFTRDLGRDLADGTWDDRHGRLRSLPAFEGSLILVTSLP
jgi:Methyltransferase domain